MENNCNSCAQKSDCHQIYEAMCKSKNQSMEFGVTVVFLMPLLVFLSGIIACRYFFYYIDGYDKTKTIVSVLLSVGLSLVYILAAKKLFVKKLAGESKILESCKKND